MERQNGLNFNQYYLYLVAILKRYWLTPDLFGFSFMNSTVWVLLLILISSPRSNCEEPFEYFTFIHQNSVILKSFQHQFFSHRQWMVVFVSHCRKMTSRTARHEESYSSSNVVRSLNPSRPLSPPQKNIEYNNNNLGEPFIKV